MKKILSMIMLCVISIMCFGENYYWEKVKLTSSEYHKDGEYIICYETPGNKIKVFQNFMTQAITINKTNDSTVLCDDSLQWSVERIENRLYNIQNNNGYYISTQYEKSEYGTLEYTETYGLVDITSSGQIYSYHYNSGGCFNIWQCISYDKANNVFKSIHGEANISLYIRKYDVTTGVNDCQQQAKKSKKVFKNGCIYVVNNDKMYNLFGKIVKNNN